MSDENDRDVQDWFKHSVEELPHQPFTQVVLLQVRRNERRLLLQRYAALFALISSFCLLLPELIAPLNMLAALPLLLVDVGGEQWPLIVLLIAGVSCWLVNKARHTGLLRVV